MVLTEVMAGLTVDDIRSMTEAEFTVAPDLCEFRLA